MFLPPTKDFQEVDSGEDFQRSSKGCVVYVYPSGGTPFPCVSVKVDMGVIVDCGALGFHSTAVIGCREVIWIVFERGLLKAQVNAHEINRTVSLQVRLLKHWVETRAVLAEDPIAKVPSGWATEIHSARSGISYESSIVLNAVPPWVNVLR